MFKNKFMFCLKFLLSISLMFFNISSAEYLLFKKVDGKNTVLDIEEYRKALNVVMKWQFPMSLNNLDEIQSLPEDELTDLCEYEIGFIKQRLLEAGLNNIELKYIPTILYEVFILGSNFKKKVELLDTISVDFSEMDLSEVVFDNHLDYLRRCLKKLNYLKFTPNNVNDGRLMSLKFEINNKISNLLYIDAFNIYKEDNFNDYFNRLFDDRYSIFESESEDVKVKNLKFELEEIAKKLYVLMTEEKEAYEGGNFLIYRGSSHFLDSLKGEGNKPFKVGGVSYGNTLFAGFLRDYDACAFAYMFDIGFYLYDEAFGPFDRSVNVVGYTLKINKLEYLEKDSKVRELFFIPPIDTLIGLISSDEGFHSRAFEDLSKDSLPQNFYFCEYLKENANVNTFICIKENEKIWELELVDEKYSKEANQRFFYKKDLDNGCFI